MATTTTAVYTVDGMSCGHCVNAVTEEVTEVDGVTDVAVDLETKKVTITSEGTVDDAAVRAAIDEAGYEVRD
ncbi:heavy-metal-associated domain-containing protein [Nocardiopsis salina]|uniref:heavy-metal-associated domain-containing protein n=1 Tax=Nocardiopsis salina TaxID=245836 RepID=UPI0003469C63|nr:cation transporter [Nocardiopsis salina]